MNYEGEKFLLKLYKELYNKQSVKHSSTKSDNKYEVVKKYIERLERVHEKAINHKSDNGIKLLKSFYYDKYVIKKEDIPESYINYLDKVQFDQYGIHMNEYQKEEQKDLIIEDQKKSLDEWIDYFTSEDAKFYPTWAKYWAFQGMLTIGNYDTNKGIYNKRSKTTVAPFPELDREVLSKSINLVIKEVNKEEINDKDLEQLVKNGNFFKLYTIQLKDKRENNLGEETKGKWIKYEQGDNYQELHKSLQGKNTGWCTAGEETCKLQVKGGDFYVYYTYDEEGKATIPRLAIRMDGKNTIGEIRGVGKDQNIEPHFEDILAKKLENFKDAEHYKKRVKDTQMLTYMYTKYENNKTLTEEDLKFIYEIDNEIDTMGWTIDPRLQEMRTHALDRVKKDFQDKDLIVGLVKHDIRTMEHVSPDKIDPELALNMVRSNDSVIQYLPKDKINRKIALVAVQNKGFNLKYVPKELRDKEISKTALLTHDEVLEYVPEQIIDKELALLAVRKCGLNLAFVPKKLIDKEIVLAAVKEIGIAIMEVPEELIDKELAKIAVESSGHAIKFIPKELIDKEIALTALQRCGDVLPFIPKEIIDKDIFTAALEANDSLLRYMPSSKINKEMALIAVQKHGYALGHIPKEIIDKDIVLAAVKSDGYAIQYVPKEFLDKELVLVAVKKIGGAVLRLIPEELVDKEVAITIVQHRSDDIRRIPKRLIDKEVALTAIENAFLLPIIQYIPKEIIDKEIALAAIEKNEFEINFIQEELKEEITKELQKKQNSDNNNKLEQNDTKPKIK